MPRYDKTAEHQYGILADDPLTATTRTTRMTLHALANEFKRIGISKNLACFPRVEEER